MPVWEQSHGRKPWELGGGLEKKKKEKKGGKRETRWGCLLPGGGDVAPPLLISPLCFALLELLVCWVRSLPDTRLRDLTFTDRKSRERESKSERERGTEREVEKSLTQCNRRRATPTTISCLLCSPLTTKSAVLSLKFHPPLLDLGL